MKINVLYCNTVRFRGFVSWKIALTTATTVGVLGERGLPLVGLGRNNSQLLPRSPYQRRATRVGTMYRLGSIVCPNVARWPKIMQNNLKSLDKKSIYLNCVFCQILNYFLPKPSQKHKYERQNYSGFGSIFQDLDWKPR